MKRPLEIVNFSGGKDSTYMLLEMIRREIPFDMVLNVDTGMEFPAMYDHIDQVERLLQAERGMSITRLKPLQTFEDYMFHGMGGTKGYGWPAVKVRWCTGHLKTKVIDRYTKDLPIRPHHYIAYAADEGYRLKRKDSQDPNKRYPLVEWDVTEAQALAGCYEAGFNWNGLYEGISNVSCWCCPLQGLNDLRTLWRDYPEIWTALRDLDDRAIQQFGKENPLGQFRQKESVRMLEFRFLLEQEWAASGKSTRSRAFYRALEQGYQEVFYPGGRYFTGPDWKKNNAEELLAFVDDEDLTPLSLPEPPTRASRPRRRRKHDMTR